MKRSKRTILFFLFALLFLLITPLVIMYSQGYRLDWENANIVKTGALYLEPRPAPVEIYIDNKLTKRSNFVFQNTYIGNLFPKTYRIEIRKNGYQTWQKDLVIFPQLVTEARNIVLFSENAELQRFAPKISLTDQNMPMLFQDSATSTPFLAHMELPDMLTYTLEGNKLYYITKTTGVLQSLDLDTNEIKQITYSPLFVNSEKTKIISIDDYFILSAETGVFLYHHPTAEFVKIGDQAKKILPTKDHKKILLLEDYAIDVYWLRDSYIQFFRDAGDKIKIIENASLITDAVWLTKTNEHIIFADENAIKVAELDKRGGQNIQTLVRIKAEKLFYEEKENTLYFLSENIRYALEL